ncbi:hypothetical protein VSDG_02804 [Cytospora chrysosperma]|uniref:Uncharacterized protein n=1 Tax=Cytospora chrysosperma TaxID=252740 RepID=A0A423WC85_CYTCH|nr:hypothetical protein VSDG_02804 [Valsa sordida]
MHICAYVKSRFARAQGRAQSFVNRRLNQKAKRRSIQISEPFGFKHVSTKLPGVTDDEINVLREKAIASRFVTIDSQLESSQKPPRPNKTRANYRGLTSSPLTASRPSITRSFATEDSVSQLGPASIYTTASSGSDSEARRSL